MESYNFSYKEKSNLQKIILFTLIQFFPENTVIHYHLIPNNLYEDWVLNQKTALVLNINYNLLNLSLISSKFAYFPNFPYSFTDFRGLILKK